MADRQANLARIRRALIKLTIMNLRRSANA